MINLNLHIFRFLGCYGLLTLLLMGCNRTRSRNAGGVKLLANHNAHAQIIRSSVQRSNYLAPDLESRPGGGSQLPYVHLPASWRPIYKIQGRRNIVVIASRIGTARESRRLGVWVVSASKMTSPKEPALYLSLEDLHNIHVMWNENESSVAIFRFYSKSEKKNVDVYSILSASCKSMKVKSFADIDFFNAIWRNSEVICVYTSVSRNLNIVSKTNLLNAKTSVIYQESANLASPFHHLVLSPSKKFLALDRVSEGGKCGISLINLHTRKFWEITGESNSSYYHQLGKWETNQNLLCLRLTDNGAWDLFSLRLPKQL